MKRHRNAKDIVALKPRTGRAKSLLILLPMFNREIQERERETK